MTAALRVSGGCGLSGSPEKGTNARLLAVPIKPMSYPADGDPVWWLLDFVIDAVVIDRIQRRRSRRREREFMAPQVAIAKYRADQSQARGRDYFSDPPRQPS